MDNILNAEQLAEIAARRLRELSLERREALRQLCFEHHKKIGGAGGAMVCVCGMGCGGTTACMGLGELLMAAENAAYDADALSTAERERDEARKALERPADHFGRLYLKGDVLEVDGVELIVTCAFVDGEVEAVGGEGRRRFWPHRKKKIRVISRSVAVPATAPSPAALPEPVMPDGWEWRDHPRRPESQLVDEAGKVRGDVFSYVNDHWTARTFHPRTGATSLAVATNAPVTNKQQAQLAVLTAVLALDRDK